MYPTLDSGLTITLSAPATWNSLPVELRTSSLSTETLVIKDLKVAPLATSASEDSVYLVLYKSYSFIHSFYVLFSVSLGLESSVVVLVGVGPSVTV